jgi:ankyrin repeat protein
MDPKRVFNASFAGKLEKLRKLIDGDDAPDWGCLLDWKNSQGATSLHAACQEGHAECAAMLIDAGASVDALDSEGGTPLLSACRYGRVRCVEVLIKEGASTKHFDSAHGATALHVASQSGFTACVEQLLASNADPSAIDGDGATALHIAAYQGHAKCVRLLLDAGASTAAKYCGKRPVTWARKAHSYECADMLEAAAAGADEEDDSTSEEEENDDDEGAEGNDGRETSASGESAPSLSTDAAAESPSPQPRGVKSMLDGMMGTLEAKGVRPA